MANVDLSDKAIELIAEVFKLIPEESLELFDQFYQKVLENAKEEDVVQFKAAYEKFKNLR